MYYIKIMNKIMLILFLCFSNLAQAVEIQNRVGEFFKINEKTEHPLFIQKTKLSIKDDLNRETESEIFDSSGKVIMKETAIIENGLVKKQVMDQFQINERYELSSENNQIVFKTFKISTDRQYKLVDENSVLPRESYYTGPSLEIFLKKYISDFNKNKKMITNFGIFELLKFLEFNLKKIEPIFKSEKQQGVLPLEMKVDSFLFSLFADSLFLEIDEKTGRLLRYRGRTPVRILEKGQFVPFDADIYYELK